MLNIPYSSVPDMLKRNTANFQERPALKYRQEGKFITLTYGAFYERVLMAARGLKKCGMKPGQTVAILSENRAGWVMADMGILSIGGVTVPIYPSNTPEQIQYVLNHSEARIIFVSSKVQYSKLLTIRKSIPNLELVVSFDQFLGEPALPLYTFYQLSEVDHPVTESEKKELEAGIDSISLDDPATLIYTSGTTGVPKGVILTHSNILFDAFYTIKKTAVMSENDTNISFLPLSHILERTVGYYMPMINGSLIAFADSMDKVPENMLELKPTNAVSVPRLFEKIYSRIYDNVHQLPTVKKKLFHWAVGVGKAYVQAKYITKLESRSLSFKYHLADRLVFKKLRERFGGNMKLFCCGGAPLDKTINEFFWGIGLPILEGYGLTETSPVLCFNNFEQLRFGSVGTTLEHTEVKVEADGELLFRGPQVMKGYYKDDAATREALRDGWFHTGDIGHVENGFIFITDRKKELIITAGGKNIAPQPIENELKLDKYIANAFVFGDRKPYLCALLVPDMERLIEHAREKQIQYVGVEDLIVHKLILQLYEERIAEINSGLARYETIKKFTLLPRDFSIEDGEMTVTLKLRRKVIVEKHKEKIEKMYTGNVN